jgi:hypothetical protein
MATVRALHGAVRCFRDGALAGLAGGLALAAVLFFAKGLSPVGAALGGPARPLVGFLVLLAAAAVAGVVYELVTPRGLMSASGHTLGGAGFGIVLWICALLVLIPWLGEGRAVYPWSVRRASDAFPTLLAFTLFGLVLGRIYDWLQCRGCAE